MAKLLKQKKKRKKKKMNGVINAAPHQRSSLGDLRHLGQYRPKEKPKEKKLTKRQRLHERVERLARSPDYPIPRQYQQQDKDADDCDEHGKKFVPPAALTSTASAHVFVAKIACIEADLEPGKLFANLDGQRPLPGSFYEFLKPTFGGDYPPSNGQPEVAFLGRSNVGKSSLINAIMRHKLAVTSKTPGRTQSEYYYGLIPKSSINNSKNPLHARTSGFAPNQAQGFIVDLPGFGFAAAPGELVDTWQDATQDWLVQRRDAGTLRRVFLLQDARLQVPQMLDNWVSEWMEASEIPYTIVLTKADTITVDGKRTAGIVKHANLISMRFQHLYASAPEGGTVYMSPFVHATSSRKNTGMAEMVGSVLAEFQQAAFERKNRNGNPMKGRNDEDDDDEGEFDDNEDEEEYSDEDDHEYGEGDDYDDYEEDVNGDEDDDDDEELGEDDSDDDSVVPVKEKIRSTSRK